MRILRLFARPLLLLAGLLAAGLLLRLLPAGGAAGLLGRLGSAPGGWRAVELILVGGALCAVGVPRQLVCYAGGLAFGAWAGAAAVLAAELLGCAANFAWARMVARGWVAARLHGRLARVRPGFGGASVCRDAHASAAAGRQQFAAEPGRRGVQRQSCAVFGGFAAGVRSADGGVCVSRLRRACGTGGTDWLGRSAVWRLGDARHVATSLRAMAGSCAWAIVLRRPDRALSSPAEARLRHSVQPACIGLRSASPPRGKPSLLLFASDRSTPALVRSPEGHDCGTNMEVAL